MRSHARSALADVFDEVFDGKPPPMSLDDATHTTVYHPVTGKDLKLIDVLQMSIICLALDEATMHRLIAKRVTKVWQILFWSNLGLLPDQHFAVQAKLRRFQVPAQATFEPELYAVLSYSADDKTIPDPP